MQGRVRLDKLKKTMTSLQTVVGNQGGPVPGSSTYQNDLLRNSIVQFCIINNVPENGLQPDCDYTHNPLEGTLKREHGNTWILGDKVIIVYSKCNQC